MAYSHLEMMTWKHYLMLACFEAIILHSSTFYGEGARDLLFESKFNSQAAELMRTL